MYRYGPVPVLYDINLSEESTMDGQLMITTSQVTPYSTFRGRDRSIFDSFKTDDPTEKNDKSSECTSGGGASDDDEDEEVKAKVSAQMMDILILKLEDLKKSKQRREKEPHPTVPSPNKIVEKSEEEILREMKESVKLFYHKESVLSSVDEVNEARTRKGVENCGISLKTVTHSRKNSAKDFQEKIIRTKGHFTTDKLWTMYEQHQQISIQLDSKEVKNNSRRILIEGKQGIGKNKLFQ